MHAGIDIAVPEGTPIRAADSGRVALMGWVGGYGNYTCIQHTASMSTCYGHQSRFAHVERRLGHAGPGDRLQRQHRQLDRAAPALRDADQRVARRPDGLPLAAPRAPRTARSGDGEGGPSAPRPPGSPPDRAGAAAATGARTRSHADSRGRSPPRHPEARRRCDEANRPHLVAALLEHRAQLVARSERRGRRPPAEANASCS